MPAPLPTSKTLAYRDLRAPVVAEWARALRRFAFRMGVAGTPFAVNGILRRRFKVSRHKLWEYARSAAAVFRGEESGEENAPPRVLDFGGAATLPVLFFAQRGCEVECLDLDIVLVDWTNELAARRGWRMHASEYNLAEAAAPAHWQPFDAIVSASVLEHVPKRSQELVMRNLGALLRHGGVLALSFDFGEDAPQPDAIRTAEEVHRLVAASGLSYLNDQQFEDTGERFALDRRHPRDKFTFGSLFLQK